MKKTNLFTRHLHEVGLSYWQHFFFALMLARKTFGAAMASLVHAFLPFLFETYTSRTIDEVHNICADRLKAQKESEVAVVEEEQLLVQQQ
jgi:hypothetical protein